MHSSVSPHVALFPPHRIILILILVAKASIQAEGINDNTDEDDKSNNNSSELTQLSSAQLSGVIITLLKLVQKLYFFLIL